MEPITTLRSADNARRVKRRRRLVVLRVSDGKSFLFVFFFLITFSFQKFQKLTPTFLLVNFSASSSDLGKYGSSKGICEDCLKGWYSDSKGAEICIKCKLGELDNGATKSCSLCDLGKYGKTEGICSPCAAGTFQDTKGKSSCQECPVDTYLSQEGKSSKADCEKCSSEKSTGAATSNKNLSSCLCKKTLFYMNSSDDTCNQCPAGADCSHKDGIHLNEIVAINGFWRPHPTSKIFSAFFFFSSSLF